MNGSAGTALGTEPVAAVPCPAVTVCGGCPLMPVPRAQELEAKHAAVRGAFARQGLAAVPTAWACVLERFGYRNRLRLRISADGRVAFFNPHKIADCAVLEPALARLIERVREFALQHPESMRPFVHLEARAPDLDGRAALCLRPAPAAPVASTALERLQTLGEAVCVAIDGVTAPEHMPSQRVPVADDVYARVPLDTFLQINTSVNRALVASLRALARERGVRSFADLYAGCGNFGLGLLRDGATGSCVELQPSALPALARACAEQALARPASYSAAAEDAARSLAESGARFDLVIVDAPRAGVKAGIEHMAALSRQSLAVCSCNPESLARDLLRFTALGFALERVLLFDMFPNTRHVEVLAWLERR